MAVSQSLLNQVQELYIAFFDRPADFGGLNYWANALAQNGDNVQVISDSFATSPEAQNLYPSSTSVNEVISDMFENLFNRVVDPTGLQFWANAYNTYHMSYGQLAYDILQAGISANNSDTQTIDNRVQAANVFTNTYQTTPYPNISIAHQFVNDVTAYQDLISLTPQAVQNFVTGFSNQTFQLTPGVDNLTGTNAVGNTFDGAYSTWNPGDQITGEQGANNTFNLTDDRTSPSTLWNLNPANTSVSDVQNVIVNSNTAVSANTTAWSGVTNLNITTGAGGSSVTAAPTTTISLTDNDLGNGTDKITGGQNVSVTEYQVNGGRIIDGNSNAATPTLGSITTVSLDAAGAPGVATITDNNLQNLTVSNFSGGSVTIQDNSGVSGYATTLNLTVNNDTGTTITESDSNNSKGQYKTLNISTIGNPSNIILGSSATNTFNALTTLNVSGSSTLTLSNFFSPNNTPILSTLTISGNTGFTAAASVLPTSLTSITDSSSGVVNVVMPSITTTTPPSTTASFNGSAAAGQEIVTITQPLASTASIQGGTATNDTLVIKPGAAGAASNFTTDTVQGVSGIISSFGTGTISGFEVVGINDTYGNSFDIAALGAQLGSSFNNTVDLQTVTGTDTLYNLANNSTLQFDSGVVGTINSTAAVNSMNILLNGVPSAGPIIDLSSLNGAGAATLNIQDMANSTSGNTIDSLTDNTLTSLNITANNALTISTLSDNTPSPVTINLSGAGTLNLGTTTFNTPTLTINSTSSGDTTISSLTDNALTSLNITANHSFNITTINDNSSSTSVAINLNGAGALSLGTDAFNAKQLTITDNSTNSAATAIGTLTDDNLTTLNLAGSHSLNITTLGDSTLSTLANINFSGSGTDNIETLNDSATTLTIANTGTGTLNINTFSTTLTTLTLNGNVGLGSVSSGSTTVSITDSPVLTNPTNTGFTLAALQDNAGINLTLTDAPTTTATTAAFNNIIQVGTGTNVIILNDTPSTVSGHTTSITDTITFADNSAVFNGNSATPTHFTAVALGSLDSPGTPSATDQVVFDFSWIPTSGAFSFNTQPLTLAANDTTLAAALADAQSHLAPVYNAGYFVYNNGTTNNTYFFADSTTGHQAIIELVGVAVTVSNVTYTQGHQVTVS